MQYHNRVMNGMMISFHCKTVKCTNHLFSGRVLHTVLWLNGCMCSIVLLSIFTYGLTTAQLGVEYYSNKKGWMTTAVLNTWITNWNHNLRWMQGNRKVVLFVDQASTHVLQDLSNIRIQFLPPNTTSKLQPMDQGVIRSLKCHYRSRLTERYLAGITEGQTTQQLAKKNRSEGGYGHADCFLEQHPISTHWELFSPCWVYPGYCAVSTRARYSIRQAFLAHSLGL